MGFPDRFSTSSALAFVAFVAFVVAAPASFAQDGDSPRKAYVSDTDSGTITIVDLDTFTRIGLPLDVGNTPRGSDVHPDGSRVYFVNQHAEDVIVLDTATDTVVTRTPVGGRPFRCGISPDGTKLYVACHTGHDVWKLLTSDNTATQAIFFAGGGMQDVKVRPNGSNYLAMNNNTGDVSFVGAADDLAIGPPVTVAFEPHSVAYSADGNAAIVVGEGDTYFIDVATRVVLAVPANGEHEEVRIAGNIAYATNLASVTPLPPAKAPGGPKAGTAHPPEGSTTIDLFDMTTHEYLRSIVLGGLGANGLALSPDGTTAFVTMRTSNELREVNLVTEAETGRTLAVGMGPRSVSVVFKTSETAVVSYFLPRSLNVKLKGAGRDFLGGSGFFDVAGANVDYAQPVTIEAGGFSKTFTLVAKGKGFKSPKDPVVKFAITPSLKGSSRGKFKLKIAKTTLAGLVDPAQPLALHFRGAGLADCAGTIKLTSGRYRLGKARGALVAPVFYPQRAAAKLGAGATDKLTLRAGFATNGQTPAALTSVRVAFGPAYSRTIPGGAFKKRGDVFRYSEKNGPAKFAIAVDFLRETVTVAASRVELGDLAAATADVAFSPGSGGTATRVSVKLGGAGTKRAY